MTQLEERYQRIFTQLQELLPQTSSFTAKMATTAALLHHKMPRFFWTGFYILESGKLIVGPYQGPLACQILKKPKGTCWTALFNEETLIIPDVHDFPGHIPCDSRSNSEIVVPLLDSGGKAWAVLDVDSTKFDAFTQTDRHWLEKIAALIQPY